MVVSDTSQSQRRFPAHPSAAAVNKNGGIFRRELVQMLRNPIKRNIEVCLWNFPFVCGVGVNYREVLERVLHF